MGQPLSRLVLYSIDGVDSSYENFLCFKTKTERNTFFTNHIIASFENCYYFDENQAIVVELAKKQFYQMGINYLSFYNEQDGFINYCFITSLEYVNENCTRVFFEKDVLQTYWFDIDLKKSLISRCHQPRWNENGYIIEYNESEGLNYGEYIIDEIENICELQDSYIVVSTDTLGETTGGGSVGGGGIPSTIRKNVYQSACKLLGKPYRWGGNYPPLGNSDGTDCSGLCQWAYNDNGITIGRTTYDQILEGVEVDYQHLRMGDLVFTRGLGDNGHVVMFKSFADTTSKTYNCIEAKETGTNIMENVRTWTDETCARNILGETSDYDIELPNNDKLNSLEQYQIDFVLELAPTCIQAYRNYNLRASVMIAQGIEESGWGVYDCGANNLFGIKADSDWIANGGEYVTVTTQEEVNGEVITIQDKFRKYSTRADSIQDHINFLLENPRYDNLRTAETYQEQCRLLQEDGYATSSIYAEHLINIINSFDLFIYDF